MISRRPRHPGGATESRATATNGSRKGRRPRIRKEGPHVTNPARMEEGATWSARPPRNRQERSHLRNDQRPHPRPFIGIPGTSGQHPGTISGRGSSTPPRMTSRSPRHLGRVSGGHATATDGSSRDKRPRHRREGPPEATRHLGTDGRGCTAPPSGQHLDTMARTSESHTPHPRQGWRMMERPRPPEFLAPRHDIRNSTISGIDRPPDGLGTMAAHQGATPRPRIRPAE